MATDQGTEAQEIPPVREADVDKLAPILIQNQTIVNLNDQVAVGLHGHGFGVMSAEYTHEDSADTTPVDIFRDPSLHHVTHVSDITGVDIILDASLLAHANKQIRDYVAQRLKFEPRLLEHADTTPAIVRPDATHSAYITRLPKYTDVPDGPREYIEYVVLSQVNPPKDNQLFDRTAYDQLVGRTIQQSMQYEPDSWTDIQAQYHVAIKAFKESIGRANSGQK